MKLTLEIIKKDNEKRTFYLQGFSHGNVGVPKQNPSYEKESYDLGYKHGREGLIEHFFDVIKAETKKFPKKEKPNTRKKKK